MSRLIFANFYIQGICEAITLHGIISQYILKSLSSETVHVCPQKTGHTIASAKNWEGNEYIVDKNVKKNPNEPHM